MRLVPGRAFCVCEASRAHELHLKAAPGRSKKIPVTYHAFILTKLEGTLNPKTLNPKPSASLQSRLEKCRVLVCKHLSRLETRRSPSSTRLLKKDATNPFILLLQVSLIIKRSCPQNFWVHISKEPIPFASNILKIPKPSQTHPH